MALDNFQSHAKSRLEFCPGLNILVGPSDSGKTAIIRGIRWALYNEPLGDAFRRLGTSNVSVQLDFTDAQITREREKNGANRYTVNDHRFEGFGTGVPLEVTEAHGMPKLQLGDFKTSLNIAFQLDPAFLLGQAGSVAAKILGKLAGTEVVDASVKDLNTDLYRTRQEKTRTARSLTETLLELAGYAGLPELLDKLNRLTNIEVQVEAGTVRKTELQTLGNKHVSISSQIECTNVFLARLFSVPTATEAVGRATEDLNRLSRLTSLKSDYLRVQKAHAEAQQVLVLAQYVDLAADNLDSAIRKQDKLRQLNNLVTRSEITGTQLRDINNFLEGLICIHEAHAFLSRATTSADKLTELEKVQHEFANVHHQIVLQKTLQETLAGVPKAEQRVSSSIQNSETYRQLAGLQMRSVLLTEQIDSRKAGLAAMEQIGQAEQLTIQVEDRLHFKVTLSLKFNLWLTHKNITAHNIQQRDAADLERVGACNELETIMRELGTCPTCLTPITDEIITKIVKEM